jgi:TldD protein
MDFFLKKSDIVDHLPLISLLTNRDIQYVGALQEVKSQYSQSINSNGKISSHDSFNSGTGFQIINGNSEGFYSANDYDGLGTELLEFGEQIKRRDNEEDAQKEDFNELKLEIDLIPSGFFTPSYQEEVDTFIKDVDSLLQDLQPIARYKIQMDTQFIRKKFQSSKFIDITQSYSIALLSVEIQSSLHPLKLKRVGQFGGITKQDLSWNRIEEQVSQMKQEYLAMLKSSTPKPDNYSVILCADTAYSLAHESIGHGCEGDQIANGNSFLAGWIGHKVASTDLTIVDDSHVHASGWADYDDEGTKTQGTILVDEGFLSGYLHTRKTAKMMNTISTGNARATSYYSPPEPRQSNVYIEPKDFSLEELLEEVKNGLLIGPTIAASTSIYTGEYSIDCQLSYQIKNGEIGKILGPVTLTGHSLDTLSRVIGIGNTTETFPSFCLKDDSRILIGAIAPPLAIADIKVN